MKSELANQRWYQALSETQRSNLFFVWQTLVDFYGAKFAATQDALPTQVWGFALQNCEWELLKSALTKLCTVSTLYRDWPPNPAQFLDLYREVNLEKFREEESKRLANRSAAEEERVRSAEQAAFVAHCRRLGFDEHGNRINADGSVTVPEVRKIMDAVEGSQYEKFKAGMKFLCGKMKVGDR